VRCRAGGYCRCGRGEQAADLAEARGGARSEQARCGRSEQMRRWRRMRAVGPRQSGATWASSGSEEQLGRVRSGAAWAMRERGRAD
jgi:hypothetical protein